LSYQNEFKGSWVMPKKQFSSWSQILLKYLMASVRCHVSANETTTCVNDSRATPILIWDGSQTTLSPKGVGYFQPFFFC